MHYFGGLAPPEPSRQPLRLEIHQKRIKKPKKPQIIGGPRGGAGFLVTKQVRRNSKKDRKTFKTQGPPGFFGVCGAAFCCFFNF